MMKPVVAREQERVSLVHTHVARREWVGDAGGEVWGRTPCVEDVHQRDDPFDDGC